MSTISVVVVDPANSITAEAEVPGVIISSIPVQHLLVACKAAKYYDSIDRVMVTGNIHYTNIIINCKIKHDAYDAMKKGDDPDVPKINTILISAYRNQTNSHNIEVL